ncbi:MAG: hypothetical protein HLUCCO15_00760 [Erythrobacteraceae bacterium HL-111]|nr:MAG: hypothetical protein HLUCCO15_00760 [Erythrobacteraceae bacterium HL-111]
MAAPVFRASCNDELMPPSAAPNLAAMVEINSPDTPTFEQRLARAKFRAWHRGTREADYMIGGFFDRYHATWGEAELEWFEDLLAEDDVDVMAWGLGTQVVPERFRGALIEAMRKLDYVDIPR